MLPERPLSKRDAARLGLGALVFAVAFAVAATLPDRLHLAYLEPIVGLLALALLVAAALARAPRRVQVAYRRGVLVGFGLLVGGWTYAVLPPPTEPLVVLVPLTWLVLASADTARAPSLPWALGIASAPILGATGWILRSQADRYGSWGALARELLRQTGVAGSLFEETVGVLLLFGVAPGLVAYVVGKAWHAADGRWPTGRRPDDRTIVLAGLALLSALLGLRVIIN